MNQLKTNKFKGYLKVWAAPISLLIFLFLFGALGYRFTEGWDWGDCLWMVLITITTIGFGEVEVLSSAGRIITFLIIGGGLFVVQLTLQRFIQLSELGYFIKLEELRLRRLIRRMKNHVIICGYGRTGREIADQLKSEKISTLIIENDSTRKTEAEEKGFNVLLADATMDETLLLAGVKNCRSLVVTLPNDAANLYVVLSAKALNDACRLIARAANEEAASKLKLAGADAVVSPYVAAGRTMAASALRPIAVDFIDLLAGSDCEIEEFKLSDDIDKIDIYKSQHENVIDFSRRGDALLLATGSTIPRDLNIEGRNFDGIHFAMEYLTANTKKILNPDDDLKYISAKNKDVIVIGGGDTGTDCIGTALRQDCKSLVNFELLPQPPSERTDNNPWPSWPRVLRTEYGHEEAISKFGSDPRAYKLSSKKFLGDRNNKLKGIITEQVNLINGKITAIPDTQKEWKADLIFLAMGFLGPEHMLSDYLDINYDERKNYQATYGKYKTNQNKIFAAGDCRRGQSLVVNAINEGREVAREIDIFLMGQTQLP